MNPDALEKYQFRARRSLKGDVAQLASELQIEEAEVWRIIAEQGLPRVKEAWEAHLRKVAEDATRELKRLKGGA